MAVLVPLQQDKQSKLLNGAYLISIKVSSQAENRPSQMLFHFFSFLPILQLFPNEQYQREGGTLIVWIIRAESINLSTSAVGDREVILNHQDLRM